MIGWIEKYGLVLAFYILVVLLIYINRRKFEFQGKIIAIYKTKLGLKLMQKIADKWPRLVLALGTVGIYVGFIGMLIMVYFIFLGTYNLIFVPEAPPMFSPILPGVSIPGSPVTLPLIEGLLALFVVVVIHEFMHGVISKAYKIPVTSSGFVMMGPIPGAFVEPDEKKLKKAKRKAQLAIFAGGPFANVILAVVCFGLMLAFSALSQSMYTPDGIVINDFSNESENEFGGRLENLSKGEVILFVNDAPIQTLSNLSLELAKYQPNEVVVLGTNEGQKAIVLSSNPANESLPYLGVYLNHNVKGNNVVADNKIVSAVYFWIVANPYDLRFNQGLGVLGWIVIISLGIGIVNLLPLGPMDGGRMYLLALEKYFKKKHALKIWSTTSIVLVFLLVVLILIPIIKALI